MQASWNNIVVAESDDTIIIENNHYFPPSSIKKEFFEDSEHHTICPWKGEAFYYTLNVEGKRNENAAWFYPVPKDAAQKIKNYIAFWKGVKVEE